MSELSTDRKKDIVLDMDWRTAASLVIGIVVCALSAGVTAWRVFTGAPVKIEINWQTWFVVAVGLSLAVQTKERDVRIAMVVFALNAASRILLGLIHASIPVQTANAEVARAVVMLFFAGVCFYLVWYFWQRIRRS